MKRGKVIVVSGVTASGKTTLVRELSRLADGIVISFDDYSIDALPSAPSFDYFLQYPRAAINQYDISLLLKDLKRAMLLYPIIFVDFPFGYEHQDLRQLIDTVIYLKTPLDIAFARQIKRDYTNKSKEAILTWADTYLSYARELFVLHEQIIAETADYVLDGARPADQLAEQVKYYQVF